MKPISVLFGAMLFLGAGCLFAADASYTLVRGQLWHGVKIGGESPRGFNSICRNQICYILRSFYPLSKADLTRYGLKNVRFESLAVGVGVVRQGDRLQLPAGLGDLLYQAGWRDYMRNRTRRGNDN